MTWCFTVHGPEWGSSGDFAVASRRGGFRRRQADGLGGRRHARRRAGWTGARYRLPVDVCPRLARGEVVAVLPEWQLPMQELWTLLPAGRQPGAKASAFLAFVTGLPGVGHTPAE